MIIFKAAKLVLIINLLSCWQHDVFASEKTGCEGKESLSIPQVFAKAVLSVYPNGSDIEIDGKEEAVWSVLKGTKLEVDLSGTDKGVTEKDLKSLPLLADVIYQLDLSEAQLGNAALVPVSQLTELRALDLTANYFDDEAFTHVAKLPKLEILRVMYNLKITPGGLEKLLKLKIRVLALSSCTNLGNPGVQVIKTFEHLEHLGLESCGIDDDALSELLQMKSLQSVNVSHNKFTADALADFITKASDRNLQVTAQHILS